MAFDQGSIPKDLRPVNVARLNAEDPHISNSSGVGRSPEGFYSNPPRPDSSSPQSTPVYFTVSAADPAFTSLGFSNTAIDPTQAAALPMWGGCWPTPVSHPGVSAPHMSVTPPANLSNPNPLTNRSGSNGVELASDDGGEDSVSGRKVKFLCSFGGKIIPRPSDGMLRYVGGQTRIISVKKDVSFNELVQKMMGIYGQPVVIKYQLPDEDLDALVSISCPDDLENMMEEYENLLERSSDGSSKLRVFLFSASEIEASGLAKFEDLQDNGQKYVDAVNGVAEGGVVGGMTRKGSIASVTSTQNSDLSGSEAVDNLVTCQEVSGPPSTSILSPGSDSTINSENPLRPSGIDANSSAPPSSSSSFPMAVPVSPGPPPVVVSLPETSLERTMHLPLQQQPPLKGYDLPPQQSTGKFPPPPSPYLQGFVDSRQEPLSNMTTQYQNFPPSVLYGNHPMVMTGRPVLLQPHYGETIPGVAPQQLLSPVHMSVAPSSSHVTANPSMIQQMPSQSVVAVQADQSYNAFQAQVHHPGGVAGYGWHQVPHQEHVAFSEGWVPHHQPQVMMSENVARMEDCGMCQKQLPHAHSDSAVPDQKDSGIPSTTMSDVNSLYRSLRLDDVSRIHGINQGIVTGQGEVAGMGMAPPLQSEEPIQRIYPHMSHVNPETFVSKPVTSGNPIGGGMPFITTEPMSHELAAPREDKIESNTSGGFVRPVEHFQMSPPVISPSSEQGRSSPIDQPRKNEIFDQSSQHTLPNTDYTNPSLITEANSVVPMTSHTNLEPASVNNNLPSSVSPSNWAGNMQDSANSLFSNQDPFYFRHESHFPPPKPTKITTRREGSGPRNPHLENRPVNNGEYNMQGHFVDPSSLPPTSNLSKDQGSDQILSTRGSSEDLAKQELQTTAEGVAASPLQPSMSSNVNSSDGSHGRGIENSNDHVIPSKTEGMNVKSEKANPGFPLADSLGRLQIIKNSDLEELRELGSGTFGTVYYGKWRGTDVAIKRINDRCFAGKPSEQERMREDFWNEAIKLADLHHPNVVAFYGVVTDGPGDSMATVTEYMVNGSLRTALQKNERTLDKRKKILIAMDVAFGMEYLHFRKIVHFDLKSDNLLVNLRDPHRPICKVGDLGLSKVKCQTLISGGVRGTLPWMAPELLNGSSSLVSEKVDVFSYGIVMWELITGDEPYADLHYGAIIGGIVSNTLRPAVPDDCDPDWKSLMERCWSAEPNERPSFTEVANELRAMAAKLPPKSSNQGSTQRASNNAQGA